MELSLAEKHGAEQFQIDSQTQMNIYKETCSPSDRLGFTHFISDLSPILDELMFEF